MPATRTLEESYWLKTDRRGPDECWPWLGTRNHKGYGEIVRRRDGRGRFYKATRVAWSIHHGRPFPDGMLACHSCDNPSCVNPNHIWPGTSAQNTQDAIAKGRMTCAHLRLHRGKRGPSKPRTHCRRGHELTAENTINRSDGRRQCRACKAASRKAA